MTSPIDRRKFLKAAGATAAAGLVVGGTAEAASASAPSKQPNILISPIIGPIFLFFPTKFKTMFDFVPMNGTGVFYNPGGSGTPPTGAYHGNGGLYPLVVTVDNLANGDTISSVTVYGAGAGALTAEAWVQNLADGTYVTGGAVATQSATISATVHSVTVTIPDAYTKINNQTQRIQIFVRGTSASLTVSQAKITYTASSQGFFPIAPARVYDSRLTGGGGPLASGSTRDVSVANQIDVTTGAVVTSNIVPDGAYAITYNLTAASPKAPGGFLAIFAKGGTLKASALNFTAGEDVANGGVVTVSSDRMVTVQTGGGGSTDFVIDITGYYI